AAQRRDRAGVHTQRPRRAHDVDALPTRPPPRRVQPVRVIPHQAVGLEEEVEGGVGGQGQEHRGYRSSGPGHRGPQPPWAPRPWPPGAAAPGSGPPAWAPSRSAPGCLRLPGCAAPEPRDRAAPREPGGRQPTAEPSAAGALDLDEDLPPIQHPHRSEERRVGKECRSPRATYPYDTYRDITQSDGVK